MSNFISIPIFEWDIDWTNPANGSWEFDLGQLQIGFGPELLELYQEHLVRGFAFQSEFRDDAIEAAETFFNALTGRSKPFWLPGPIEQFEITAGINRFSFKVKEQGSETSWQLTPGLYLMFSKPGELNQFTNINSIVDNLDGTETIETADELDIAVDDTWSVQPLYLVRLADDVEEYTVCAERCYRRDFKVVELPHDYERLEPGVIPPSKPVFYYKFTAKIPTGDVVWRFTSNQSDVTLTSDSSQWLALGIDHSAIRRSASEGGTCAITGDYDSVEPLRLCSPMRLTGKLIVEILQGTDSHASAAIIFTGLVSEPNEDGKRISVTCKEFGDIMQQKVPNFFIQRDCPYQIYDPDTCKADKASKQIAVTITAASEREVTLSGVGLAGIAEDYFALGWIECGTGLEQKTLFILSNEAAIGTTVQATISGEPDIEAPIAATIVPGCPGTRSICISRFNNLGNFGGGGNPLDNLSLTAIKTGPTGGKGK